MEAFLPIPLTDSQLIATNVPETDHAEWAVGTTYADGDRVIVLSTHSIYESVQGSNTGNGPTTDDGTWWIKVSATNRWAAFDLLIAAGTSNAGSITYEISPSGLTTSIAFFDIVASQIQVRVEDAGGTEIYSVTRRIVDDSAIIDWFTFFTEDLSEQGLDRTIFEDVPGFPTYSIFITIGDGTGTPSIGEIAYGKSVLLGRALDGTSLGLTSFSSKEQDQFGNWTIVPRAKSDPVRFNIATISNTDVPRVKRFLDRLRDKPAVYTIGDRADELGAIAYGLFVDYEIPLVGEGVSIFTLEVEGLT